MAFQEILGNFPKKTMARNLFTKTLFISVFTLSLIVFNSCKSPSFVNTEAQTQYISIDHTIYENTEIDSFLSPFRQHIEADLSKILCYNPENLNKTDAKWQNPMTNLFADVVLEIGNSVFEKRTGKSIDFCLLNYGGIRANIAKGDISTRTAFEIMPFENFAVVLKIDGATVYKIAEFILKNQTAHPLSNMEITAKKDDFKIKQLKIGGNLVDKNKEYYVITNDYLAKGGDHMDFFFDATETHSLDYKLRNMFIAYFSKTDTLTPSTKERIIFE